MKKTLNIDDPADKFLILLVIADMIFICVHILYIMNYASSSLFSIEKDFGFAEVYQYIKEFWIVILLLLISIRTKQMIYLAWSVLFLYLLADDSLRIHEQFGRVLVSSFDIQPAINLRAQDFGELLVSAFAGSFLFSFIGLSYFRSKDIAKTISKYLFVLLLCLVFFGIFLDMVHMAIPWGKSIWGLLEDGGEMVIMSIIVWYVFNLKLTA